jgi:hypothetical protein
LNHQRRGDAATDDPFLGTVDAIVLDVIGRECRAPRRRSPEIPYAIPASWLRVERFQAQPDDGVDALNSSD